MQSSNYHVLIVIPVRRESRRLVDKPLRKLWDKTVIEHVVADVVAAAMGAKVVLATDSMKVAQTVKHLVEVCMTPAKCQNGTARVAAALNYYPEYQCPGDMIVNVQGDQLFVSNEHIEGAIAQVEAGFAVGTMCAPLAEGMARNSDRVKVLLDPAGQCLDFFRLREQSALLSPPEKKMYVNATTAHHLGIYAYRPQTLQKWAALALSDRELLWGLEQLTAMGARLTFGVGHTTVMRPLCIDNMEDLKRLREMTVGDVFKLAALS